MQIEYVNAGKSLPAVQNGRYYFVIAIYSDPANNDCQQSSRCMPESQSTTVVRSYLQAFNERDRKRLNTLLASDVVEHGVHDTLKGRDAVVQYLKGHFEAFPDYSGENHEMIAEGELVAVRYTARGTHTGEYKDIEPTGLPATWTGIAIYHVDDGKIDEIWLEEDRLGLLEQLQYVDTTEPAHLRL